MPVIILNTTAGILCIISGFLPDTGSWAVARTVLTLLGRIVISGSFVSLMVWTTELYPTVLRSNGMGMAMFGLRIGGVISPQIILLVRNIEHFLKVLAKGHSRSSCPALGQPEHV